MFRPANWHHGWYFNGIENFFALIFVILLSLNEFRYKPLPCHLFSIASIQLTYVDSKQKIAST